MMRPLVALLALSAVLAGCAGSPESPDDVDTASHEPAPGGEGDGPAPPGGSQPPASEPPRGGQNSTKGNATSGGRQNATQGDGSTQPSAQPAPGAPARQWPPLEQARVRPGMQTYWSSSQCTSNFIYTSPDNQTLYVGVAAHCFRGAKLGDAVELGDGGKGVLAYSSWITMGSDGGNPTTGANPTCSQEEDKAACVYNDFALVRVDESSEPLVHPAMLHFGGPTALAPSGEVQVGDKVLTYGNTWLRQGLDPSNRHEGYVLDRAGWTTTTYTATPGVPGDSGSGVMLGDGRAFGVLVTVHFAPTAGANGVTSLDMALDYARQKAGIDVRLATWALLTPGVLPS